VFLAQWKQQKGYKHSDRISNGAEEAPFERAENRALRHKRTRWDTDSLEDNFDTLFRKFQESTIVVSYGDPGNPSVGAIVRLMKQYKSDVRVVRKPYNYKLNHKNGGLYEVLIIGT
jgi:hypothetical protein